MTEPSIETKQKKGAMELLAVLSFIAGLCAFAIELLSCWASSALTSLCAFVFGAAAVWMAGQANKSIRESLGEKRGHGLARAGMRLGGLAALLAIVLFVVSILWHGVWGALSGGLL